jgi:Mn2+/Fe2+ NRAMP family transporter
MQKKNWVIFFITGMIVFISYFIGMAIYDHTSFLKTAWPMPVVAAISVIASIIVAIKGKD